MAGKRGGAPNSSYSSGSRAGNFRRENTRKGSSGGSNRGGGGGPHYEPNNKALGIFAAVVVGIAVVGMGPEAIFSAFGSVADNAKDMIVDSAVDAVKDAFSSGSKSNSGSDKSNSSSNNNSSSKSDKEYKDKSKKQKYTESDYDVDLELEDIEDIFEELDSLAEDLKDAGEKMEKVTKVGIKYSAFDSIDTYKEAVINRLEDFKDPVSFVSKSGTNFASKEELDAEFDRITDTIVFSTECKSGIHEEFSRVTSNVIYHTGAENYMEVVITYY